LKVGEISFAAIDFESAGTGPSLTDEPVQVAVAHWSGGDITTVLNSYIAPTRAVTWAARKVHGISDIDLKNAPPLFSLWPKLRDCLGGRWLVAHSASTEKRFLRAFPLHGFGPWLDTLWLARAMYPRLASHALGGACVELGLMESAELSAAGFRWHDAGSDAVASLVLLRHLLHEGNLMQEPAEVLCQRPLLTNYFEARRGRCRPG